MKKFDQFINENKNYLGVKLGDKICRGKVNSKGMTIGKEVRDYRVIGLNPNIKLQEILSKKGEQELGKIEEFDWREISGYLRPMFPDNHFIHSIDDGDWSHIWIGDF